MADSISVDAFEILLDELIVPEVAAPAFRTDLVRMLKASREFGAGIDETLQYANERLRFIAAWEHLGTRLASIFPRLEFQVRYMARDEFRFALELAREMTGKPEITNAPVIDLPRPLELDDDQEAACF